MYILFCLFFAAVDTFGFMSIWESNLYSQVFASAFKIELRHQHYLYKPLPSSFVIFFFFHLLALRCVLPWVSSSAGRITGRITFSVSLNWWTNVLVKVRLCLFHL